MACPAHSFNGAAEPFFNSGKAGFLLHHNSVRQNEIMADIWQEALINLEAQHLQNVSESLAAEAPLLF